MSLSFQEYHLKKNIILATLNNSFESKNFIKYYLQQYNLEKIMIFNISSFTSPDICIAFNQQVINFCNREDICSVELLLEFARSILSWNELDDSHISLIIFYQYDMLNSVILIIAYLLLSQSCKNVDQSLKYIQNILPLPKNNKFYSKFIISPSVDRYAHYFSSILEVGNYPNKDNTLIRHIILSKDIFSNSLLNYKVQIDIVSNNYIVLYSNINSNSYLRLVGEGKYQWININTKVNDDIVLKFYYIFAWKKKLLFQYKFNVGFFIQNYYKIYLSECDNISTDFKLTPNSYFELFLDYDKDLIKIQKKFENTNFNPQLQFVKKTFGKVNSESYNNVSDLQKYNFYNVITEYKSILNNCDSPYSILKKAKYKTKNYNSDFVLIDKDCFDTSQIEIIDEEHHERVLSNQNKNIFGLEVKSNWFIDDKSEEPVKTQNQDSKNPETAEQEEIKEIYLEEEPYKLDSKDTIDDDNNKELSANNSVDLSNNFNIESLEIAQKNTQPISEVKKAIPGMPPPPPPLPMMVSNSNNMINFYWDKLNISNDNYSKTIWNTLDFEPISINLEQKFKKLKIIKKKDNGKEKIKVISLLDQKKNKNFEIIIKHLSLHPDNINKYIFKKEMNPDKLKIMKDLTLSLSEIKAYQNYKGDKELLSIVDKCLIKLQDIPRYESKIESILFILELKEDLENVENNIKNFNIGCIDVVKCQELKTVIHHVLHIGNNLNKNTVRGNTKAFCPTNLIKIKDIKTNDGKSNLFEYLMNNLIKKDIDLLKSLRPLYTSVKKTSEINHEYINNEINRLNKQFQLFKMELAKCVVDEYDKQFRNLYGEYVENINDSLNNLSLQNTKLEDNMHLTNEYLTGNKYYDNEIFSKILNNLTLFLKDINQYISKIE